MERELLDILLFEQGAGAGRHVHRRRALHDDRAMIAASRPTPAFFLALALTIFWTQASQAKSITIDDSGSHALEPSVSMRWKSATPSRSATGNLMVGTTTIRVRINVMPWLR